MASDSYSFSPAWELARLVRSKEVSPVELVDHFLERIDRVNGRLNAFITVAADESRAAARKAEEAVSRGDELPPLHGVPLAVKDTLFTKGIRTTAASLVYKDFVPDYDSAPVGKLVQAGAIVIGKTNTPEFAMGAGLSYNRIIGDDSHNPWNLERTAGASSGGSAVAVAAGLAPMAIGSDAGGSIRIPAAWCGIYGLKQTTGLVSGYGGFRSNESLPLFTAIGPLTRTVRDAALMLQAMAGHDQRDPFTLRGEPADFVAALDRPPDSLRIAWSPDLGRAEVDPEIRTLAEQAARRFEDFGCRVEEATPPIDDMIAVWGPIGQADLYAGHGEDLERHPDQFTSVLRAMIESGRDTTGPGYAKAVWGMNRIRAQMEDFFEGYDLLLTPAVGTSPFNIGEVLQEYEKPGRYLDALVTFCPLANLTGGPSASVPCGFTSDGLPVGLLMTGRFGEDTTVLRASAVFEEAVPWTQQRPPIE